MYKLIEEDSMGEVSDRVKRVLKPLVDKSFLTEKNLQYLILSKSRLGRFNLLPQIHKRLEKVPVRPVISNCGKATERVSEFWDFLIQPLLEYVPSIVRDSTHFLQRLESLGHIPPTAIMCTMDVVGLYPHIPHKERLEALEKIMRKSGEKIMRKSISILDVWVTKVIGAFQTDLFSKPTDAHQYLNYK